MTQEIKTIVGVEYVTDSALGTGDYGGAGAVGEANIRSILEAAGEEWETLDVSWREWDRADNMRQWEEDQPITAPVVVVYCAYNHRQVWVRRDVEELSELVNSLEDYPLIDDGMHSSVMMEREDEAWESWVRSDLARLTGLDLDDYNDTDLHNAYLEAMDATNTYPEEEYSGVYIDVERIADEFKARVEALKAA
tara:strand:+ start:3943 stop:4524 length:582 start_codon:yes stop_codon:yes gene_type:complete